MTIKSPFWGKSLFAVVLTSLLLVFSDARALDWADVKARAKGQTVHFNAWAGDDRINAYIAWVGERVAVEHGVTLRHVKITDTAQTVARVLAEKTAGRVSDGSVDLIWINGENFAAMKRNGLLYGPFAEDLPNFRLVDVEGKPTTRIDFTVPTDGLEAPWGMAKLVFMVDTARLADPPRSIPEMLSWSQANPGRMTYPAPPDFIGSTFLKQALHELITDPMLLSKPVVESDFQTVTAPLWAWLDALHPTLWRGGKDFPANGPAMRELLNDGEIDLSLTFNPGEASSLIEAGRLPNSVRTFVLRDGTIANTHFVAIPFNAAAKEGAMVVANFLMSAEAQARKQDPRHWGDPTVLAMNKLSVAGQAQFDALPLGIATLAPADLGTALPEPHPSWMTAIEAEWRTRHAR